MLVQNKEVNCLIRSEMINPFTICLFEGFLVLLCKMPCSRHYTSDHYHCPLCGQVDAHQHEMSNHLKVCRGKGVHFLLKQIGREH